MVEKSEELTFGVENFSYNGVMGQRLPGIAPYTATFVGWTNDPGVATFKCSDGQERLIPTFAIIGDQSRLPRQYYTHKVYFGAPSQS